MELYVQPVQPKEILMRPMLVTLMAVLVTALTACGGLPEQPIREPANVAVTAGSVAVQDTDENLEQPIAGQSQTAVHQPARTTTESLESRLSVDPNASSINCRKCNGGQRVCCWIEDGKRQCEVTGC